jgi:lipid-binding SYLF domain-containing protein
LNHYPLLFYKLRIYPPNGNLFGSEMSYDDSPKRTQETDSKTGRLDDAKCIAVVPSMLHIAVGFGGWHGKGVATCLMARGWSAPAPISITGGDWGIQLGGQAIDLVMLVMNQKGMDHLLSSKFNRREQN